METLLVKAIIVLFVAGVVAFLIKKAPFVDEPYKGYALYALLAAVVLYLLLVVALPLIHLLA